MRALTYYTAVSIDGFIAAPDGDFSMFSGVGDHIDWICREYPDTLPHIALGALGLTADGSRFDTTLMGWNTYAAGFSHTRNPYPHTHQIVFSRSRSAAETDAAVELTSREPVDVVRELKVRSGSGIWLCGGGTLAGELIEEIDHLVLKVNPVVLGEGVSLFAGAATALRGFELIGTRSFTSGVAVLEYTRR